MANRPEHKRKRRKLPGLLMTLAAMGLLLSLGGPRGVAVNSPVEAVASAPSPANVGAAEPAESSAEPAAAPSPSAADAVPPEAPTPWMGPVPESTAVEDTYFADVVFLGNSRTHGLQLYGGLEHGTFLCATGVTVESVFTKPLETDWGKLPLLDALAEMNCGKIYIMLGVNELGWNGTDTFREQSTKLIERLQADHPETEIVIQSILPVSKYQESKGTYVNNKRIAAYNDVWQELAHELGVAYLNVAEAVAGEDGCLAKNLTYDGVHLNTKGCRLWLDYLRTHPITVVADA